MDTGRKLHLARMAIAILGIFVLAYGVLAYLALPEFWYHREHQPGFQSSLVTTTTPQGIPGDPLNVGLVGEKAEIIRAMYLAGWSPADPITLKSTLEITESVVFDRPYRDAPVSTLLYDGRKQDFAFEKEAGTSATHRNHVRLWKVLETGVEGKPVWMGSVTLDIAVGISEYTGQFTHHIGANIDTARDALIADLIAAEVLTEIYQLSGVGPTINGRNGGGDRYYTDGEIRVGVISPGAKPVPGPPRLADVPPLIQLKNGIWAAVTKQLGGSAGAN
jgi:hypothetical protein